MNSKLLCKNYFLIFLFNLLLIQTTYQHSMLLPVDYEEPPGGNDNDVLLTSNEVPVNRIQYQNFGKLYVKIAVFVDEFLRMRFKSDDKQIKRFASTLLYASQILYNRDNMRQYVSLKFLVIYFGTVDSKSLNSSDGQISNYLGNFCNHQKTLRRNQTNEWNAAILLSGMNLFSQTNDSDLGLAYLNTICTENACSVIETRDFIATNTITHELGHNFNLKHDGLVGTPTANCAPNRYIMAAHFGDGRVNEWSNCSVDAMASKLTELKTANKLNCLVNQMPVVSEEFDFPKQQLPGVTFPIDEQCKYSLGPNYKASTEEKDICRSLYCNHIKGWFSFKNLMSLEGTYCGDKNGVKHYCRSDQCSAHLTPD